MKQLKLTREWIEIEEFDKYKQSETQTAQIHSHFFIQRELF